jgi:hypothetical protein
MWKKPLGLSEIYRSSFMCKFHKMRNKQTNKQANKQSVVQQRNEVFIDGFSGLFREILGTQGRREDSNPRDSINKSKVLLYFKKKEDLHTMEGKRLILEKT